MEELNKKNILREIPSISELLDLYEVKNLIKYFGRDLIINRIRLIIENLRKNIHLNSRQEITRFILKELEEYIKVYQSAGLKKVINATGIVLHTNLGRAPLPQSAIESMKEVSEGYSNLEFNLESGTRGSRYSHIEPMLKSITGAEAAIVVNNNAAAVFICLNTLANNKEVIISRGQQVEIGGSFRIPDIITRSSARMVEVGTTNKTRLTDYSGAISDETSVLLKVHTSNYKITGFTEEVSLEELAGLSIEKHLVVMEDLGSGCLYDLSLIGLPYEPTVQDSIKFGADIVTFSGDKLLGGPQAGIIIGRKALIDKIKKNPLMRMLRCDKVTIAALSAVLDLYMNSEKVIYNIPVLKMMALKEAELFSSATELEKIINRALGSKCKTEVIDDLDEVGGGSLPGVILSGKAVSLTSEKIGLNELQEQLRKTETPIICRINKDRIILNVRTLEKKDFEVIVEALVRVLGEKI